MRILLTNMGYARDIGGSLKQHMLFGYRHLHSPVLSQKKSLNGLKTIIKDHTPDICCLLEIDRGSLNNFYYNQIHALIDPHYHFYDIENKYAEKSRLRKISFANGKCNGFIARNNMEFEKHYLSIGAKRLVYMLKPLPSVTLLFTHFSLRKETRYRQFLDLHALIKSIEGSVVLMGDFNIFTGFEELKPLLEGLPLTVLSDPRVPTFTFSRWRMCLDLCICTNDIADKCELKVLPQPYSDHDALLLEVNTAQA